MPVPESLGIQIFFAGKTIVELKRDPCIAPYFLGVPMFSEKGAVSEYSQLKGNCLMWQ